MLLEHRRPLEIVAGIFIVLAGLVYLGAPLPLTLLREKRLAPKLACGVPTAALAGVAFGIGYRSAVGVVSGSMLVVFGALLASGYLARLTRSLAQFTGLAI